MSKLIICADQEEDTQFNIDKIAELRKLYEALPFGNSTVQDEVFALGGEDEKCPWVRAKKAAINLESKLEALEENIYLKRKSVIEYKQRKSEYEKMASSWFKSEEDRLKLDLLELDLEKAETDMKKKKNLFLDCTRKIDLFAGNLLKCKEEIEARGEVWSYEGFTAHDRKNFEARLIRQFTYSVWAGQPSPGDISSLAQLGIKVDYDRETKVVTEIRRLGKEELKVLASPPVTEQEIVDKRIEDYREKHLELLENKSAKKENE